MTAAENIRAYLTAYRQSTQDQSTFRKQGLIAREGEHYLREVDLEVVLQILQIFSDVGVQETEPPAELTTPEQLSVLPPYTLIQASDGGVYQRWADPGAGEPWETMGSDQLLEDRDIALPARVLTPKGTPQK